MICSLIICLFQSCRHRILHLLFLLFRKQSVRWEDGPSLGERTRGLAVVVCFQSPAAAQRSLCRPSAPAVWPCLDVKSGNRTTEFSSCRRENLLYFRPDDTKQTVLETRFLLFLFFSFSSVLQVFLFISLIFCGEHITNAENDYLGNSIDRIIR